MFAQVSGYVSGVSYVCSMSDSWGGAVIRTSVVGLVRDGLPDGPSPTAVAYESLRAAQRELIRGERAVSASSEWPDAELESELDLVARAQGTLERTRLRLARQVAERGLHRRSGFSLSDWLQRRCPDLNPGAAHDLARLARASADPVYVRLVDAVAAGELPASQAAKIQRAGERIRGGLTAEQHEDTVSRMTDAARGKALRERDLDRIISDVLRRSLPEKDPEDEARAKRGLRDLSEMSLANGSVKRLVLTFGDDADYQAVRAIITSPLAAPASQEEQEATGVPDERTPGQRRYDAVMTVLMRGVAGSDDQPVTPKAKVIVTIDLEALRRDLSRRGDTAAPCRAGLGTMSTPGAGATLGGALLPASAIRRLACEAEVIPMVLGGPSEILDQGRAKRLVTPGQRLRLAVRDRGCTIPGCTVPAAWCDAHHVVHWARGGRSDLSNYALLCPRHHTFVHERDLGATVTADGLRWRLR